MTEINKFKCFYLERKERIINSIKEKNLQNYYTGFVFALENDIYPYLHTLNDETSLEEIDLFETLYFIKKDFISKVLRTADELYKQRKNFNFYDYEDIFGEENRNELIYTFRYAFLSKKFINFNFWNTLIDHKNNPDEANWIIKE